MSKLRDEKAKEFSRDRKDLYGIDFGAGAENGYKAGWDAAIAEVLPVLEASLELYTCIVPSYKTEELRICSCEDCEYRLKAHDLLEKLK